MSEHAIATAFCISTDATGVCVQPIYSQKKGRQPCKKGHFLVMIADRDHIVFEYLEKENGRAIHKLFRGYSGYVQSDAKSDAKVLSVSDVFSSLMHRGRTSRLRRSSVCDSNSCGPT